MTKYAGKKLVAAMSGGVDSSVAAALMKKEGCQVIGATLKLIDCDGISEKRKSCCGIDDRRLVMDVCRKLEIDHYFLDVRELFEEKVLRKCLDEYSKGRTPNPCALCNRYLKFEALLQYARTIGAEGIITGHYAKIAKSPDGSVLLSRASDMAKDQSYFLSLVKTEHLALAYMPLNGFEKKKVRSLANELGLPNAGKKESQDACVGLLGENFAETLRIKFAANTQPGRFADENGQTLGRHNGIHNFTIGQRRGFGMSFGKPVFVTKINSQTAEVTLSSDEKNLFSKKFNVEDINWFSEEFRAKNSFEALVQIRYKSKAANARVKLISKSAAEVEFSEAQRAITPGQTAAFYHKNSVIAGGIISTVIQ